MSAWPEAGATENVTTPFESIEYPLVTRVPLLKIEGEPFKFCTMSTSPFWSMGRVSWKTFELPSPVPN